MTKPIPEEPKFVRNINYLQRMLAGIAVTMYLVVWAMGWAFVVDIFKPDYVKALTFTRVGIALFAMVITSILGYQQIGYIMRSILEIWDFYKKMLEMKRDKEK